MYTQDLIDEVKELYPNNKEMHTHAENGSVWLGRYLDDSSPNAIPIDDVLKSTSLEDLKKKAQAYKRKLDLYAKWCKQDPRKK